MTDAIPDQSSPEDSPTGASSAGPSAKKTRPRAERLLTGLLAAMVAIYSILMAVTNFSASRAEGLYYDNAYIAQAHLNDASELAIEANIRILHDLSVWEQIRMHELSGSDPAIIEFLYGQFSAEAQASLERSGKADEIYDEEVHSAHIEERELAMMSFEHATAWSQRAGTYQALATMLVVGLAFAALASLMDETGFMRRLFTLVAALILVVSLCFLGIHLITRESLEEYVALADYKDQASIEHPEPALAGGLYVYPSGAFEFAIPTASCVVPFVLLVNDPNRYIENAGWLKQFGTIEKRQTEDYGVVTSLRVWYVDGHEVEYGLTSRTIGE